MVLNPFEFDDEVWLKAVEDNKSQNYKQATIRIILFLVTSELVYRLARRLVSYSRKEMHKFQWRASCVHDFMLFLRVCLHGGGEPRVGEITCLVGVKQ